MQMPSGRPPHRLRHPLRVALFYLGLLLVAVGLTVLVIGAINTR